MGMKKIFCTVLLIFLFLLAGNVNTLAIENDEDELFNNPVTIQDGISVSIFDFIYFIISSFSLINRLYQVSFVFFASLM